MLSDPARNVLAFLRLADGPVTAIEIGGACEITGTHESVRRRVRAVVAELRSAGHTVHSDMQEGYWMDKVNADYQDRRQVQQAPYPGQQSGEAEAESAQGPQPVGTAASSHEPGQGHLFGADEIAQSRSDRVEMWRR